MLCHSEGFLKNPAGTAQEKTQTRVILKVLLKNPAGTAQEETHTRVILKVLLKNPSSIAHEWVCCCSVGK